MNIRDFNASSFGVRFFMALVLVFATYNPSTYSYFHWVRADYEVLMVQKLFVGVVLLIGWVIFIRATWNSLGILGLALSVAFFGTLIWMIVDWGLVPADSRAAITYIVEFIMAAVMATGMSWSHIRRRLSGQIDTDEIEG